MHRAITLMPPTEPPAHLDALAGHILDAAFAVHNELGPGLLEVHYEEAMARELIAMGHAVDRQVPVTVLFRGKPLSRALRLDLVVDGSIIVEVKAVSELHGTHLAQVRTYLRASGLRLGLVINFDAERLKGNIRRLVWSGLPSG